MERHSQGHVGPERVPLEDYWQEFSSFEESVHPDEDEDEAAKTPDEGEAEEEWLREAGFEVLVNDEPSEEQVFNGLLSTLTTRQRDVVLKRLQSLELSKKKKHRNRQRADVRQVFNCPTEGEFLPPTEQEKAVNYPDSSLTSIDSDLSDQRPLVLKGSVQRIASPDQGHKSTSSSVLPQFLWSSHSGGFSLSEHSKALDSDGPTSVEVLRYESRKSVQEKSTNGNEAKPNDVSFQSIASKLDSLEKQTENEECSSLNSTWGQYIPVAELGEEDRAQVRSLAMIEVTALLDGLGIVPPRSRKRTRKKGKENVVFGCPLATLLEVDRRRCPQLKIPLVYQWMLRHLHEVGLEEVGLMRLAGSVQKIETLKAECEKHYLAQPMGVENSIRQASVYDVAVLLKQLIRQLPEPLLTNSHINTFLQVPNIPNSQDQISALNLLVLVLPDVHRELLQELLYLLARIAENESLNRMSLSNVSMIMAPNLFPPPRLKKSQHHKSSDLATEVTIAALSSKVTQFLIKYSHYLGMVPKELLVQARLQSQYSSKKQVKRSRGRKCKPDKLSVIKEAILSSNGHGSVIKVQLPSLKSLSAVPVTVNERTTAGEVIQKVAMLMDLRSNLCSHVAEQTGPFYGRVRTESEPPPIQQRCLLNAKNTTDCLRSHTLCYTADRMGEKLLRHDDPVLGSVPGLGCRNLSTWSIRCNH